MTIAALAAVATAAFAARVLLGDYTITIPDALRIVGGADLPGATFILMETKLPRAVLAVLVGISFGLAGAIFQATLRNPLASPDIIGVSVGASASAVVALVVLDWRGLPVSMSAVAGALGCALLVRAAAGGGSGGRLVLAGIGLSAALLSVIQFLFTRADVWDAHLVLRWLTGSVSAASWPTIRLLALLLLILLPAIVWTARTLPALELGSEVATGLGAGRRAEPMLALGVVLAALGVAAAGPIAFVAFLSGPISRALLGGRTSLTAAALVGATIVVAGDYVADYLLADINFPVGVVTGALGAPILLWLLASGRTHRRVT